MAEKEKWEFRGGLRNSNNTDWGTSQSSHGRKVDAGVLIVGGRTHRPRMKVKGKDVRGERTLKTRKTGVSDIAGSEKGKHVPLEKGGMAKSGVRGKSSNCAVSLNNTSEEGTKKNSSCRRGKRDKKKWGGDFF